MEGTFSEGALLQFVNLVSQTQSADFSEGETYDFTRCVKPDGKAYGTRGKCRKGTEQTKDPDEKAAIKQLGGMLPKGEKIMDSKGGLHTAAGKVKEKVSKKAAEREFSSFDKLTQDQRDRRIRQQTELVRDLKKDGNADWKSERGRLDRMLDKDKEVAAAQRGEAKKAERQANPGKETFDKGVRDRRENFDARTKPKDPSSDGPARAAYLKQTLDNEMKRQNRPEIVAGLKKKLAEAEGKP
jgi:hypothetical protein